MTDVEPGNHSRKSRDPDLHHAYNFLSLLSDGPATLSFKNILSVTPIVYSTNFANISSVK